MAYAEVSENIDSELKWGEWELVQDTCYKISGENVRKMFISCLNQN